MNMNLSEIAELDRLIEHLEKTIKLLESLYLNIDDYDRNQAAAKIATATGTVRGVVLQFDRLRG